MDSLFDTLNQNCNAAEDHAHQLLMSYDIPVITAYSSLSKGDCMLVLRKHSAKFNKLEQAVFLSTMTDYVSCAHQNELYDVFNKGNKQSYASLLLELESKWMKFFMQLKSTDLTYVQLRSLVSLLKCSVNRLANYNFFLKTALNAAEIKLEMLQSPSYSLGYASASPQHQLKNKRIKKSLLPNAGTAMAAAATCYVMKSQNNPVTTRANDSPAVKSVQKVENENKGLSSKLPSQRKYGADITKYILKSSQNRAVDNKMEIQNTIEIIDLDANILGYQKSQNLNTTAQTNFVTVCLDSPSMKKQKLEKLQTGKVNAFALLMKNSKSLKKK